MKILNLILLSLLIYCQPLCAQNRKAPDLNLPTAQGKQVSLQSLRGKYVLLDFWASWCGSCQISLPWLSKLNQKLSTKNFQVLAINVDQDSSTGVDFLSELGISLPTVFDSSGGTPARYEIKTMPTSFLIGPQGQILARYDGFSEEDAARIESDLQHYIGK